MPRRTKPCFYRTAAGAEIDLILELGGQHGIWAIEIKRGLTDRPERGFYHALEGIDELIVPSICIYEVFRRVAQQCGENDALRAIAMMRQGKVVDLDSSLSIHAAQLGLQYKLPLADSIIMASAQIHSAIVWTQDNDFEGLPDVRYIKK